MPPSRPIILIDQDNVLADQLGAFHRILKEEYPEVFATYRGETTSFAIEDDFGAEHKETILEVRRRLGFFRDLRPLPGAIDGIRALAEIYDVRICSAPIRTPHSASEKYSWVRDHLGEEFVMGMVLTRDKTLVRGDLLIDDNPHIEGLVIPSWTHVLFDQPYNRGVNGPRISWDEKTRDIIARALEERKSGNAPTR